jgi:DNA-binding transcriptional LysR family regulator
MERFIISPDDCLILKAFKDSKSLREAAVLLNCDPAGLARRVQVISNTYGFLQKVNNRWQVTSRGLDLVAWTEVSIQSQKNILSEKNSLRIASRMWFSEEVLMPNLKSLIESFGQNTQFLFSSARKNYALSLIDGSVDFVLACHPPENPEIEHRQVTKEKWSIVTPISWKKDLTCKRENVFSELKKRSFIRHQEMNIDLFFPEMAEASASNIVLDNLIGVRAAVMAGHGWSLVPTLLVNQLIKEKKIFEIPFELSGQDRKICVWWLRNRYDMRVHSSKICNWVKEFCE